jgi:prevent-host-death family protein
MKIVTTHEAKTHLSALLQEVSAGETIVISRGKTPLAKLVPIDVTSARPKVGEMMDDPFVIPDESMQPLHQADMKLWGL